MTKKILFLGLLITSLPAAAFAADTSDGCGVGWSVTQSTTLSATTTRSTTNSTLPNTFSMTSGSSGCAKHPIAKADRPAFDYAFNNSDSLTIEMARGQGENLTAFARTLGCSDGAIGLFGQMTQRQYQSIGAAADQGVSELFDNIKGQIQVDPVLSVACRT